MKLRPVVTLIALVSADGFISSDRGVPWHLPRDKAHFRAATAGHWLLVGRTTYEEMLGWFADHHPLVLTRDRQFRPRVGEAVHSVEQAVALTRDAGAPELMVLGGGPTFAAAMPWADRLLLTRVKTHLGEGVPFPPVPPEDWQVVAREEHPADAENSLDMTFMTFQRRKNALQEGLG